MCAGVTDGCRGYIVTEGCRVRGLQGVLGLHSGTVAGVSWHIMAACSKAVTQPVAARLTAHSWFQ